jgi:hypothetical protein
MTRFSPEPTSYAGATQAAAAGGPRLPATCPGPRRGCPFLAAAQLAGSSGQGGGCRLAAMNRVDDVPGQVPL